MGGRVTVIENLSSGKTANLDPVRESVEFHEADIRDYASIAPLLAGAERVFHLAAIPSVPRSIAAPIPSHEANIDGTFNVHRAYVEYVAALIIKASIAPGVAGKTYNAGNSGRFTFNETWRALCRIEGVQIDLPYGPPRAGDVRDSQADTTAPRRDLGHDPKFNFEDGLKHTLEWYRTQPR